MCKLNLKVYKTLGELTKEINNFLADPFTKYEDIEDAIYQLDIQIMQNNNWMKIWAQSINDCPDDSAIYSKQIIYASEENQKIEKLKEILTDGLIAKRGTTC